MIIVCDDSKLTSQLGTGKWYITVSLSIIINFIISFILGHPWAVEVTPFSYEFIRTAIENLPSFYGNARAILRRGQISNNSSGNNYYIFNWIS